MAFRQPTLAPPRQASYHQQVHSDPVPEPILHPRTIAESQEWVLFPVRSRSSVQTNTASTAPTPRTAGVSRLSDFGSLDTVARVEKDAHLYQDGEEDAVDEDEDLDSLDDGLHAFQESSLYLEGPHCDQSESVFPRHDGLGMFPASSPPVQEQLWHFEQYNPRKKAVSGQHRRRSSVQRRLDAVEDSDEATIERERVERIEKWRLEQSKVLLDEVEKQTRRRLSRASQRRPASAHFNADKVEHEVEKSLIATFNPRDESAAPLESALIVQETFWKRVTRRVIQDFIGIDDAILAIIFGEALPSITADTSTRLSLSSSATDLPSSLRNDTGWEKRLLNRISRELGILIHQLSDHPGAFSTPSIPPTLEYAGIPITYPHTTLKSSLPSDRLHTQPTSPTNPHFAPTLQRQQGHFSSSTAASDSHHAALWGIEEEDPSPQQPTLQTDLEYWERPPTLTTLFRFLHHRFIASRPSSHPTKIATTSTADSLRRAAIIRQHHPLVSRAYANVRRRGILDSYTSGEKRRGDSSCASSAKRRRSESSRNYWDLGGSESAEGGFGVGVWGEV